MSQQKSLSRREFLGTLACGTLATAGLSRIGATSHRNPDPAESNSALSNRHPNIVIIFIDDLGYGDLSCYGSKTIKTPNVDQMADEGIRFTDFYVCASVCTPSRAGLLTGRYQIRSGLTKVLFPDAETGMPDEEITMGEALKSSGYATCCIGKWHLGDRPQYRPTRHGFDHYFGLLYSNDMESLHLYRNNEIVSETVDQSLLTEQYTREAIDFITRSKDGPFLLYLPHTMPHVPLFVSEKFAGKSAGGKYGDVVECIDWGVGQILDTIKQLGLDDNTLVMFTSDNGPWLQKKEAGGNAGPLRDGKFSVYEGGVREPFVARWPGRIPAGTECDAPAISLDLFATSLALAGVELPKDRIIDGKNILPLLTGESVESPHDTLYFHINKDLFAIRSGRWKMHVRGRRKKQNGKGTEVARLDPPELYDLERDLAETKDVAGQHPDVVAALQKSVSEWESAVASDPVGIDLLR